PRSLSTTLVFLVLATAGAATAVSCTPDESNPGSGLSEPPMRVRDCEGPATSLPAELAATLEPRPAPTTPDDQWAHIAREVPGGFAGVLYDNGQPVLMLTRPQEAQEAKAALASRFPPGFFDVAKAEVRRARWDFAQLADWDAYLGTQGLWRPENGVRSGGMDEAENRIVYGVLDAASRARVADELDALGVPCDLVLVEIRAPIRALSR
ncbi:MAG TPA: hypothetical protein VEU33_50320, partial [Archangium sp.]|nr:hypothetical protein [Archangium sp.]